MVIKPFFLYYVIFYIDIVPGFVDSVYVKTSQTMAMISWDIPDYIPANYSIITYEIAYIAIDDETMCLTGSTKEVATPSHGMMNVTLLTAHIDTLMADTCYVFAVRAYTDIGHGGWSLVAKPTAIHENITYGEHCKQNIFLHELAIAIGQSSHGTNCNCMIN